MSNPNRAPYIPDDQLDAEIERLKKSPDVRLANRYKQIQYRRRIYLYELRAAEKRGKALRAQGITEETLSGAFRAEEEEKCLD